MGIGGILGTSEWHAHSWNHEGDPMADPHFAKPDRYKLDSYKTYNFKWTHTYDSCVLLPLFGISRWDASVVKELTPGIDSVDILDAGCATGRLIAALYDAGAKNVSGTDLAPRILDVARQKLTARGMNPDLRAADVEDHIPWPDASFDVVTLSGVFHHLMRPKDALLEISRLLRSRGRLILLDPWFVPPIRQAMNLYLRFRPAAGDCRYYSPSEVAGILSSLGWQGIRSTRACWSGFMICAERPE